MSAKFRFTQELHDKLRRYMIRHACYDGKQHLRKYETLHEAWLHVELRHDWKHWARVVAVIWGIKACGLKSAYSPEAGKIRDRFRKRAPFKIDPPEPRKKARVKK